MKIWTVHLRQDARPVLVREGFSWGACLFGPFWLVRHRAWVPAALALAAELAASAVPSALPRAALLATLAWLLGLFGRDLRRWGLARRGYDEAHVVAARSADAAMLRLLDGSPDLGARL